ncbi:hypothetical protein Aca07nite_87390 [Actinoplanes capillaceus]|uniref:AAA+ ATPase domain-containing protein n=1 Tax=Actinoplanes campanulatus TaxID=113559 RepID=A0ABQ3WZ38_9ACTN|nr:AAA family ATPase [Actinoplanes capillaceus]GID51464.1 hypothetical protein Aca07nite_87390 [Actinoplanes capillaceus]
MSDAAILPARHDELVRQVGRELIERGFRQGGSLFTPERSVWNPETARNLYSCYNDQLDFGSGSFLVKLRGQLESATDEAVQLAAELLTLQGLPLLNLTAGKLHERVTTVLSWMSQPVAIPEHVLDAFTEGTWNGGQGAHTMIWKWLADAIEMLCEWQALPPDRREEAFGGPWVWQEAIDQFPIMPSLRAELLYLAFPTHFLPIISTVHKKAIRDAFAIPGTTPAFDLDRGLFEITTRLQQSTGHPVDFYRPPFAEQWQRQAERPAGERRAWLVRPRQGGRDLVERWREQSFVSLAASHLGDVPPGASRSDVRTAVETGYQHLDYAQRVALANEYHAFLSQMESEDIVATLVDDQLYLGVIDGDAEHRPDDGGARLRRSAGWLTTPPVSVDSLPAPLPAELDQQGVVVDLTGAMEALSTLLGTGTEAVDVVDEPIAAPPVVRTTPKLPAATDTLALRLYMDRPWLQDLIELLQERRQVILYGPPGTGKTYLARALSAHVAERDAVRLVQFHPSYAYEDFFEGFRPVEGQGGTVAFAKTPGPLREIAAEARDNPERPYVLIVDEINRANLAKVFGELYFLLEYREATIRLQYSPSEAFNLPPNVFIIGTMNTADRSIALVDAAIRRRFAFVELHPDEPPVADLLRNWLMSNGKDGDERAFLLDALNEAIGEEDRDFQIGPSYLMRASLDSATALERVWRYDLLPLLEEHYYGRLTRPQVHNRFGLSAIRSRIASPTADADEEEAAPQ